MQVNTQQVAVLRLPQSRRISQLSAHFAAFPIVVANSLREKDGFSL
jgi:hypothetical protein